MIGSGPFATGRCREVAAVERWPLIEVSLQYHMVGTWYIWDAVCASVKGRSKNPCKTVFLKVVVLRLCKGIQTFLVYHSPSSLGISLKLLNHEICLDFENRTKDCIKFSNFPRKGVFFT